MIGTNAWSLKAWEEGRRPLARPMFYPGILAFLKYNPLPAPRTLGATIRQERLARGWSIERLARVAGVDPATLTHIEADTQRTARKLGVRIRGCLGLQKD